MEEFSQNPELIEKFLEEYKQIRKEKNDLDDKFDKLQKNSYQELQKERNLNKKLDTDLQKIQKQMQNMKAENSQLQQLLKNKEQQIKDMQQQIQNKSISDEKTKERDAALFLKTLQSKPILSNTNDAKILNLIRVTENSKLKIEEKNDQLNQQIIELMENIEQLQQQNNSKMNQSSKVEKELQKQIDQLKLENNNFVQEYEYQRKKLLECESNLRKSQQEFQKGIIAYEQLKKEYSNCQIKQINEGLNNEKNLFQSRQQLDDSKNENNIQFEQIIDQLMGIFGVQQFHEILPTAQKMEKVVQAVPRLEKLIMDICTVVLPEIGLEPVFVNLNNVIPTLNRWAIEVRYIDDTIQFKNQLAIKMGLDPETALEHDMYQAIDQLKSNSMQTNQSQQDNPFIQKLLKKLDVQSEDQFIQKIEHIQLQLNDIKQFIQLIRNILDLQKDIRNEAVLTYVIRILEKQRMDKYNDPHLIIQIQKILNVQDPSLIISKLEKITQVNNFNS